MTILFIFSLMKKLCHSREACDQLDWLTGTKKSSLSPRKLLRIGRPSHLSRSSKLQNPFGAGLSISWIQPFFSPIQTNCHSREACDQLDWLTGIF